MKVLVLQHGSGDRYRTVQYFRLLEEEGFTFEDPHWPLEDWDQWCAAARRADIVWVARRLLSPWRLAALQRANPRIVFDFDDALWLRSSRHGGGRAPSKAFKFARTLEVARAVVGGNPFLVREACRHVHPDKVHCVPTVVNDDWYGERPSTERDEFVVGWIGSQATLGYLDALRPVFEAFHATGIPWRLKIVADAWPDWHHLPLDKKAWALADEEADLHDMDVGLNPLTDDDWSRGKCALKAVQTLAAGVPVLGSPVGANLDVIQEGVSGRLCTTPTQWFTALEELARDRDLRSRLGTAGREDMRSRYLAEGQAPRLADILRGVAA